MFKCITTSIFTLVCAGIASECTAEKATPNVSCDGPGRSVSASDRTKAGSSQTTPDVINKITLYSKNGVKGSATCSIPLEPIRGSTVQINFKDDPTYHCKNDNARSIDFQGVPAELEVDLYDDPKCGTGDDYVKYVFNQDVTYTWSWGFEYSDDDTDCVPNGVAYYKKYKKTNGLDGKVSCMLIKVPA